MKLQRLSKLCPGENTHSASPFLGSSSPLSSPKMGVFPVDCIHGIVKDNGSVIQRYAGAIISGLIVLTIFYNISTTQFPTNAALTAVPLSNCNPYCLSANLPAARTTSSPSFFNQPKKS
jgi:hypothetical protein